MGEKSARPVREVPAGGAAARRRSRRVPEKPPGAGEAAGRRRSRRPPEEPPGAGEAAGCCGKKRQKTANFQKTL